MEKVRKTRHHGVVTAIYVSLIITLVAMALLLLVEGNYMSLLQLCLLSFVFLAPRVVEWAFRVMLPQPLEACAVVFIFAACILGEVYDFYLTYPLWDVVLHFESGFLFCAFACALTEGTEQTTFAFCYSVTISTLWEFLEFLVDALFHTNMQKDAFWQGKSDIGLVDTMTDLMAGAFGALCFVLWLLYERKHNFRRAESLIPNKR